LAGQDTSEWAFDCGDVLPAMQHRRAKIFESFPVVRESYAPCAGHKYVARVALGRAVELRDVELRWTGPTGAISIEKLSLLDEQTGRSSPLPIIESHLEENTRWRRVKAIGDAVVYENLQAQPRAWLVPEVVSLRPEEVLEAIKTSRLPDGRVYDAARMALVEEPWTFKADQVDGAARVEIRDIGGSRVEIETRSSAPAFLVLSDVYYPGWKATVDGVATPILRTNYVLRGVPVPAGQHRVRFAYRPPWFYLGAGISALTGVAMLGFIAQPWRRRGTAS
jgi:hypothetical protein